MNREMKEKVNICLYLFLDAHERPTLRFPVLLYLLNPLYPLHLKPLLPVLPAAVKIFKKFRLRDLQSIFFILLKRSNSEFMWIFASISTAIYMSPNVIVSETLIINNNKY